MSAAKYVSCALILLSILRTDAYGAEAKPPKITFDHQMVGYDKKHGFRNPLSIFLDSVNRELLIADTYNHQIAIFSTEGVLLKTVRASADLVSPMGIAGDEKGNLYVGEMNSPYLKIFDAQGQLAEKISLTEGGSPPNPPMPGRLARDEEGNVYVIDRANQQILIFDRKRELKLRFGGKGKEEGKFEMLQNLTVDDEGNIYAVSSLGTPVHKFDTEGKFVLSFGKHGSRREDFSFPVSIAIGKLGNLWIADSFQHRIKVYNPSGEFLFDWGFYGEKPGQLLFPLDIKFDDKGKMYILQKPLRATKVQVFDVEWKTSSDR